MTNVVIGEEECSHLIQWGVIDDWQKFCISSALAAAAVLRRFYRLNGSCDTASDSFVHVCAFAYVKYDAQKTISA